MKPLLLALLLAIPLQADEWTKTEVVAEATFQTLLFLDYRQTSEFHRYGKVDPNGTVHTIGERNMLLGSSPKQATINLVCLLSAVGHLLVSDMMGHDRIVWQAATILIEAYSVGHNHSIGVRIRW